MSQPAVKPIPEGMHALTPHLVCANAAAAIEFYKRAFGAIELSRLPGPGGKLMHAALRINGAMLMLNDEFPDHGVTGPQPGQTSPVTIHFFVPDVDAAIRRAETAGATVVMPAQDMFWGDRYGIVKDPFGHRWSLATHQRDLSPQQIQEGMAKMG